MVLARGLPTLVLAIAWCSTATATDVPIVGSKLIVVDRLAATSTAKAAFVAKDPSITKTSGTDPAQIAARLDVAYDDVSGAFVVPPGGGWLANDATLAKYVNGTAPTGGSVKVSFIKPGKLLKLRAKSLGDTSLDVSVAPTGIVSVAHTLTSGGETLRQCTRFMACAHKSIAGGTGHKLVCRGSSVGDAACAAAVPSCLGGDGTCPVGCGQWNDADCPSCLVDLESTVLDTCTGLEWEKKDGADALPGLGAIDAANLHDVDNYYSWAGVCTLNAVICQPNAAAAATCAAQTGDAEGCAECGVGEGTCDVDYIDIGSITTIWDWLNQVNAEGFAGHGDWRLPTSAGCCGQAPELESIIALGEGFCAGGSGACVEPIFSPTSPFGHWSATADPIFPSAYQVIFRTGVVQEQIVDFSGSVRAVR